MKKFVILSLGLTMLFAVSLVFISCASTPTAQYEDFEGNWLNTGNTSFFGYTDFSFTFTGDNFVFRTVHPTDVDNNVLSGTFTFTKTKIKFKLDSGKDFTQDYKLSNNRLELIRKENISKDPMEQLRGGLFGYGIFVKQ